MSAMTDTGNALAVLCLGGIYEYTYPHPIEDLGIGKLLLK